MRIILFSSSYLPRLGGLETAVRTLARQLIRNGHKVQVVTNRYPRYLRAREILDGVPIRRALLLTPDFGDIKRGRPDLFLASLYFYPYAFLQLFSLVKNFQPDIINVHFPDAQIPCVLWLRKRFKFRLVVSLHGDEIERWFSKTMPSAVHTSKTKLHFLRLILQEADAVTACSACLLKKAVQFEPSTAGKSFVIHNGVDVVVQGSTTPYLHTRQYIFSYGRFTYKKGFDILLQAFAHVSQEYPEVDLIVAGDGEERNFLEQRTDKLGLKNRVVFYGYAQLEEVQQLLKGCQFVVLPSRSEAFGMIIIEAMASGKPVIATRSGGPEEIIEDGINGLLVDKENPDSLARAIVGLLKDQNLYAVIVNNQKKTIVNFTIESMVHRYIDMYG